MLVSKGGAYWISLQKLIILLVWSFDIATFGGLKRRTEELGCPQIFPPKSSPYWWAKWKSPLTEKLKSSGTGWLETNAGHPSLSPGNPLGIDLRGFLFSAYLESPSDLLKIGP